MKNLNKFNSKISLVLSILLGVVLIWGCNNKETQQPDNANDIQAFLQETFSKKYDYVFNSKEVDLSRQISEAYSVHEFNSVFAESRQKRETLKGSYKNISIKVKVDSVKNLGNTFEVIASVYVDAPVIGSDVITSFKDEYQIKLQKSEKSYIILDELQKPEFIIPSFEEGKKILEKDKLQPIDPSIFEKQPKIDVDEVNRNAKVGNTYNRTDAANYAVKYAISPNKNYVPWPNNCTNFTSQCLKTGGWKEIGSFSNRTSTSAWYYTGTTLYSCYSWSGAHNFFQFMLANRSRGYGYSMASATNNLQVGDIIQIDFNKDGLIDHTMIITKKDKTDTYMSYHTTNTLNKKLSLIFSENKKAAFYGWYITGIG